MTYIIVIRNPNNKRLFVISDGDVDGDNPPAMEYETHEAAIEGADKVPICRAWEFDIVEVDA